MSSASTICDDTFTQYFGASIAEAVLIASACAIYAFFVLGAHCSARDIKDYTPVRNSALRQLLWCLCFALVFFVLHGRNTWRFEREGCALSSKWDPDSIDNSARLLGWIAMSMFLWPAVRALLDVELLPNSTWRVVQICCAFATVLFGVGTFALVVLTWMYPTAALFQTPILTHAVSGVYAALLVFGCVMGEYNRYKGFQSANTAMSRLDTAHETARLKQDVASDDPHLSKSSLTPGQVLGAAMFVMVVRVIGLLFLGVSFQMLIDKDYRPSHDAFNFAATCQRPYHFIVFTFIVLAWGAGVLATLVHVAVLKISFGAQTEHVRAEEARRMFNKSMLLNM